MRKIIVVLSIVCFLASVVPLNVLAKTFSKGYEEIKYSELYKKNKKENPAWEKVKKATYYTYCGVVQVSVFTFFLSVAALRLAKDYVVKTKSEEEGSP